jgi:hypothetical protein
MSELLYPSEGYDALFARVTRLFIPALLKAARIASGHHVLDVAALSIGTERGGHG